MFPFSRILKGIFSFIKRLDVAKPRIESLNPLVNVEVVTDLPTLEGDVFENLVQKVDMVCMTDYDRESLVRYFLSSGLTLSSEFF